MANITPRTNKKGETSYLIRVFVDENNAGKQKIKSMTWKPSPGMSARTIEKELNRHATLFEEKVKKGLSSIDGNIRFEEYAKQWLENAQSAPATRAQYEDLLQRIIPAIGHIRLEKLQAHHLEEFYRNLREDGIKHNSLHATSTCLVALMEETHQTIMGMARIAGISATTMGCAIHGKPVSIGIAEKIAASLNKPIKELFVIEGDKKGLSEKTILHHHRLISSILNKAKKERIIPFNVAVDHTNTPKVTRKEAVYLTDTQAQEVVGLLLDEDDVRIKTALLLMLYSGVRRGELCGLSWKDIDKERGVIHILRASQYQEGKGVVEVPTKNESSKRAVKVPPFLFEILAEYHSWWIQQQLKSGDRWQGQLQRLFIQDNGLPINPDTINFWLSKFIERNNLPYFTPHSLRHTFATLQIAGGVDIRTLQARTGHAQASTLVNIYSHALESAKEAAADVLDNMLTPSATKTKIG